MLGRFRRGRGRGQERSASGDPILRHEAVERDWQPASYGDADVQEAIDAHLEAHLGECTTVWHEIVSDLVHIDVYMWTPTADREMYTFVTLGMSNLPMTVPPESLAAGAADRAELLVCLPADWPVADATDAQAPWDDDSYFPISWLKQLARLPHDYRTWLGYGHTVPNGDPAQPLAPATPLSGWMLLPPTTLPPSFHRLALPEGSPLDFFGIVALHPSEMDFKLTHGAEPLEAAFTQSGVTELLDIDRMPTVA